VDRGGVYCEAVWVLNVNNVAIGSKGEERGYFFKLKVSSEHNWSDHDYIYRSNIQSIV
jgi:hypothetical protein